MAEGGCESPPGQPHPVGEDIPTQSARHPDEQSDTSQDGVTRSSIMTGKDKNPDQVKQHATPPTNDYRISKGKQQNVICRVCNKSVKCQNYSTHLKNKHPKEDHKNLRSKNTKSIVNMFEPKTSGLKRVSPLGLSGSGGKEMRFLSSMILTTTKQ